MAHIVVPEAEEILDKEFKVLDKGFVRLVDYMGGDSSIVQSARVSYGTGTKTVREDSGLIRYLMRHRHTTPFEMLEFKFHAKMPIFVARQWIRHRTANVNEYSGRYSIMKEEFYIPEQNVIRKQSKTNRQGRDEEVSLDIAEKFIDVLSSDQSNLYAHYEEVLEDGIARELARIGLPVNVYTEWYWKIDLHNLLHFLSLRMDKHAQYEIREYANTMAEITKKVAPIAYEAFEDYMLYSISLSRKEINLLRNLLKRDIDTNDLENYKGVGFVIKDKEGKQKLVGEGLEFKEKLEKILSNPSSLS